MIQWAWRSHWRTLQAYRVYNPNYHAVPFERVLRDANRNHRAFFERADIPTDDT